jgi:hypothetical protein
MLKAGWGVCLLFCLARAPLIAAQEAPSTRVEQEKMISALAAIDFGSVYSDVSGDGSVTEQGRLATSGPDAEAFAQIKAIVDLREMAIPLLIQHLDDARPTQTTFDEKPVPLGHIALDILLHIVGENHKILVTDCANDGLGSCFRPGYYFRPDAKLPRMRIVKQNWMRSLRQGEIAFVYPQSWG